jgi:hypothetical protein
MAGRPPTWLAFLCCCLAARVAYAADVSVQAPAEVYVGVPFTLTVTVNDVDEFDSVAAGVIPDAPSVTVLNPDSPSRHIMDSRTFGSGGRQSIRSVTLTFQVVAEEPKALIIPAFTVRADGQVLHTRPVTIIARHSFTGDLLLLDVKTDREVYYLGERVGITLEIWLKPFVVSGYDRDFDEHEMWAQVNQRSSTFGVFEQGSDRGITYRTVKRLDNEGRSVQYYVYYLPASYVPRQAGEVSFRDVRVVASYPEQARPSRRGPLTRSRWDVVASRPIVATLDRPAIRIEPTPEEGRPDVFAGAVGRFDLLAAASPREAAVGDPITLTLRIEDRSGGDAAMELLRPPAFEQVPALVEQFRIPDDPMAGEVNGARKTFTQTIRARHERVTEVPAIPFAFFDPVLQRYETVWSDPVPLEIHAAASRWRSTPRRPSPPRTWWGPRVDRCRGRPS